MARTVGIRFRQAGKVFYYDAGDLEPTVGSYVVVDTAHGIAVGRVVISPDQVITNESSTSDDVKPLLRMATDEDVEQMEAMKQRADEVLRLAKGKIGEMELDMSLANGEFDLEGQQFTGYFTATERIDFRNLVRDLTRETGARVQLLQVGDRDRAKLTDGYDVCGQRLCCSSWMTNFPSVSIRMAKEQDLPFNPQKISGVCGRLYCCLTFEYDEYKALRGTLPKVGSFLSTPSGEAKVLGIDFNREMVKLLLTETREHVEVHAIDFKLQNGVTIRPMELVRKIEGGLRTIAEDSSAVPSRVDRPARAGRSRPPERARGERPGAPRPERPGTPSADRPAGTRSGRPSQPRAERPSRPARPTPPPAAPTPNQPAAEGDATRRRRRRRGRGRGGRGNGEGPATPGDSPSTN